MQGLIQFNGYYGCNWCLHSGESVFHIKRSVVKYPLINVPIEKRTEANLLAHAEEANDTGSTVFGVKKPTPLMLLNKYHQVCA